VYVYFADTPYLERYPVKQTAEEAGFQQAFVAAILACGEDYNKFDSLDALCRLALRDGFPVRDPDRKPNNLPFHSLGELFKGREPFLEALRARLRRPNGHAHAAAIVAPRVLHGLGGVGKTRTAIEYAWRFADDYDALLFVSAPSASDFRARLSDLVGVLEIKTAETAVEPRLAEVLRWLDEHPGWLLLVDNVDAPDAAREVQNLLARLKAGHVLITSRIANWRAGVEPLELHLLAEADAVDFLLARTPHRRARPDDSSAAAAIARQLDRLALALEQAGAYVDKKRLSFAEYLERWEKRRAEVLLWHDETVMGYPASVAVTWETTFAQLGEAGQRLLSVLSWLAPEPVPLPLFESKHLAASVPEPRDVLADLAGYSLLRFAGADDAVEVHRLVQEITRSRTAEHERGPTLQLALESVNELAPSGPDDVRTWPVWAPLSPHAASVIGHADAAGIASPTSRLMNQLGLYLNARGQFPAAEPLYRRALAIEEQSLGPQHPDVATSLSGLAALLLATNRMGEAELLMRRALAIDERSFGAEHPNVARDLDNLAGLLKATNRMGEAEPLLRRALAIDEQSFGSEHPGVARDLNNLGQLLQDTNRVGEAEPLMRRALGILVTVRRQTGYEHPNVLVVVENYRRLLTELGRSPEQIEEELRSLMQSPQQP
jgi:tetratricopeptide (TPR) repeat protein